MNFQSLPHNHHPSSKIQTSTGFSTKKKKFASFHSALYSQNEPKLLKINKNRSKRNFRVTNKSLGQGQRQRIVITSNGMDMLLKQTFSPRHQTFLDQLKTESEERSLNPVHKIDMFKNSTSIQSIPKQGSFHLGKITEERTEDKETSLQTKSKNLDHVYGQNVLRSKSVDPFAGNVCKSFKTMQKKKKISRFQNFSPGNGVQSERKLTRGASLLNISASYMKLLNDKHKIDKKLVSRNTHIVKLQQKSKQLRKFRETQKKAIDTILKQKSKLSMTHSYKNDEFLSLLRSSRGLLNKNSEVQMQLKLRKSTRLGNTFQKEYAQDWENVRLSTKERSLQKEISVRGALSKVSRQYPRHHFNRTFVSQNDKKAARGKSFNNFKSFDLNGKRHKTENSEIQNAKGKGRVAQKKSVKLSSGKKLKNMNSTARGRFFTQY